MIIMSRHKLSRKKSKKMFRKGANKVKAINIKARPMRGGFRI